MQELASLSSLVITQKLNWTEVFTGIQQKNRYGVLDDQGNVVFTALEKGNWLSRLFLQGSRPFELTLFKYDSTPVLILRRPFRFFFHEISVYDPFEKLLGIVRYRFSWTGRRYTVHDSAGIEIMEIYGPFFHPWTYNLIRGGLQDGAITKRWGGSLKEFFTDTDRYGIVFPSGIDTELKAILLGAVFLIDFVHFENK